jgi:SET domain/Pre-SET motif/Chromo (CHRromatin Organisation MOdifier) domain
VNYSLSTYLAAAGKGSVFRDREDEAKNKSRNYVDEIEFVVLRGVDTQIQFTDQLRDNGKLVIPDCLKPIVMAVKLTDSEIYDITKGFNREKNLKAYMKKQSAAKPPKIEKSRKRRREEIEVDEKARVLQEFLECVANGVDMSSLRDEIAIFKPKYQRHGDIDRYSETSSNSGRTSSTESSRPRRVSIVPERFSITGLEPKPKIPKKTQFQDPEASYEVEAIWDMNLINNEVFVQVKWENYPPKDNTWEPLKNVKDCEAIEEFLEHETKGDEEAINSVSQELLDEQADILKAYSERPKHLIMLELKNFDPLEFKCYQLIYNLVKDQTGFYHNFRKKFRHMIILNHFHMLDIAQQKRHKEIRTDIMENENNMFSVSIVNEVDFTVLDYFKYVSENIFPNVTEMNKDDQNNEFGCKCKDGCTRESKCCPTNIKGGQFAYKLVNDKKRLRLNYTQMIFECNKNCPCDENCLNRVTQQPRLFPLACFKTEDGRGWGLKTKTNIPKGTFLMEYTGEIIDQEESNRRGEMYDEIGLSYLFDLDFNETADATYTIDAFKCGNLSRLINHSCEPNCRIWPVTTCSQDSSIYKLCYFSTRLIKAGEELTFDYGGGVPVDNVSVSAEADDDETGGVSGNNIVRRHKTVDSCKCGSLNCRGFIFN